MAPVGTACAAMAKGRGAPGGWPGTSRALRSSPAHPPTRGDRNPWHDACSIAAASWQSSLKMGLAAHLVEGRQPGRGQPSGWSGRGHGAGPVPGAGNGTYPAAARAGDGPAGDRASEGRRRGCNNSHLDQSGQQGCARVVVTSENVPDWVMVARCV